MAHKHQRELDTIIASIIVFLRDARALDTALAQFRSETHTT